MKKTMVLVACLSAGLIQSNTLFAHTQNSENSTVAIIESGKLMGSNHDGVTTFYDVPYAQNPFTTDRRFQAPQAYEAWSGILDATKAGQPVPQPSRGKNTTLVGAPGHLTLNIWTPTNAIATNNKASNEKLPVMVWIPGGAFIREDAAELAYDGTNFAKNNVIVVTINYRVGVDGFMHLEGTPDNRGILDQIMALKWVQNNIEDFGGDPSQVTVAGQSAGAESVAILLGTEKVEGLFQKAIMQSPPMAFLTQKEAQKITQSYTEKLNIPATVEGLSSVPFPELVKNVIDMGYTIQDRDKWGMLSWGGTAFLPVVDGDIIVESPMKDLTKASPSIPVIVGSTDQESRLYLVPSGAVNNTKEETKSLLLSDLSLEGWPAGVYSTKDKGKSIGDTFADIQSDFTFRMPALHIAQQLAKNDNKVWHYNFSWMSPAFEGQLGAAHFVDVPFVFNTTDNEQTKTFVGSQPPVELINAMHNQWLTFIKTSKADWSPYNLSERPTMQFDVTSEQVNDPDSSVRKLWKDFEF